MLKQSKLEIWICRIARFLVRGAVCVGLCGMFMSRANANHPYIFTLADGNASIDIDLGTQTGMYDLEVDGKDQLNQQWFWYRIGNAGPEESINEIGWPSVTQPTPGTLQSTYSDKKVSIEVLYSLVGGSTGSGSANVSEQVKIRNLTSHDLDFHFFQYANLDLPGTTQLGRGLDESLNEARVAGGGGTATETVNTEVSPGAQHGVAGFDTIAQLNDKTATTLADILGPVTNSCWTLEWDKLIGAKGSFVVSQVIALTPILVPEPSALAFIVLGLVACWGICRLTRRA